MLRYINGRSLTRGVLVSSTCWTEHAVPTVSGDESTQLAGRVTGPGTALERTRQSVRPAEVDGRAFRLLPPCPALGRSGAGPPRSRAARAARTTRTAGGVTSIGARRGCRGRRHRGRAGPGGAVRESPREDDEVGALEGDGDPEDHRRDAGTGRRTWTYGITSASATSFRWGLEPAGQLAGKQPIATRASPAAMMTGHSQVRLLSRGRANWIHWASSRAAV